MEQFQLLPCLTRSMGAGECRHGSLYVCTITVVYTAVLQQEKEAKTQRRGDSTDATTYVQKWKGTCGWISSSGEEVFETLRTGNIGTSPSYWTSPMQTRERRYTCEEAVLITMDQLPLPPRRASVDTTLVRDMCSSTNGVINLPPYRWKALGALG